MAPAKYTTAREERWFEMVSGTRIMSRAGWLSIQTKLLMGVCHFPSRQVFEAFGLSDDSTILGAADLELSWRLRALGMKLVIALDTFIHHTDRASFSQRPAEENAKFIPARRDAAVVAKLERYYGPSLPSSMRLWGSAIYDAAPARRS
jgi:GT2 family glycosyltransferase